MQIHPLAQKAIETLQNNGYEAYVVGGCVRDSLMGLAPHDWDMCTSALPQEVQQCFRGERIIETGLQHGTVTVVLEGLPFEITTYRVDGAYEDGRHPKQVAFVRSLREDLARRDFTMNAMAYNPKDGLVDYFGGQADIAAGVLRAVGTPDERFEEDGLRIMRGLRFASRFQLAMAQDLQQSIHHKKELLRKIAAERLNAELCGVLLGHGVREILLAYGDVLAVFLPEIEPMFGFAQNNPHHQYDVWRHTAECVAAAPKEKALRLTMLLHDIGKPACHCLGLDGVDHFYRHAEKSAEVAYAILKRLKFDNDTVDTVYELVRWHDVELSPQNVIKWMNRLGQARFAQLLEVKRADIMGQAEERRDAALAEMDGLRQKTDEILTEGRCFRLKDLAVNGRDVMEAGIPAGEQVGQTLQALLEKVMEGKLKNEREALMAEARRLGTEL